MKKRLVSLITAAVMLICAVYIAPMSAGAYTYDEPNAAEVKYNVEYDPCSETDLEETVTVVQSVDALPSDMTEPEKYNDEFFKDKFLIFLDVSGSGAWRYRVLSVKEGESTFDIDLEMFGDYTWYPADWRSQTILLEADNSQLGKEISVHALSDMSRLLESENYKTTKYYTGGLDIDENTLNPQSEPYIVKCNSIEELKERYTGDDLDQIISGCKAFFENTSTGYLLFIQWVEPTTQRAHEIESAYYYIDEESPVTIKLVPSVPSGGTDVYKPTAHCAVLKVHYYLANREFLLEYDDMPHIHRICADADCTDNHEVKTWTAWDSSDALPEEAGYYYLTNDIVTSTSLNIIDGVYICLNGHIIQNIGTGTVALTATPACDNCGLTDCTDTVHNFSAREDGLWTLDEENGDIPIEGGTIIGSMLIASDNMFEMYNINAVGDDGNGIFLYSRGNVLLENCMLAGNNGSHALNAISPVELRNCIISANRCDSAVRVSSEFKIGGRMTIGANMNADGKSCNLELREGRTVTIAEPIWEGSYICVSTEAVPTIGNPISVTGANGEDYSEYFHSDNYNYIIVNGENNVVQLTEVNPKTYPYTINSLRLVSASGEEYDEIPISTSFIVDMDVTKIAERSGQDHFIVAAYDENNALASMNYIKADLPTGTSFSCGVNIQKSDTPIASIKAFVWDALGTMTPLAENRIFTYDDPYEGDEFETDEIIVGIYDDDSVTEDFCGYYLDYFNKTLPELNLRECRFLFSSGNPQYDNGRKYRTCLLTLNNGSRKRVIDAIRKLSELDVIIYAQPNYIYYPD